MNRVARFSVPMLALMGIGLSPLVTTTATAAPASNVTVSTQLPNGSQDGITPASTLTVRVAVTANTTGLAPSSASFRVRYDGGSLAYSSVTDGDLGTTIVGPEETDGGSPSTFRDVATVGTSTFPATNLTPICFDLDFTVKPTVSAPYVISVETDPGLDNTIDGGESPLTRISLSGTETVEPLTYDNASTLATNVSEWMLLDE